MNDWREILNLNIDEWTVVLRVGPLVWLALVLAVVIHALRSRGWSRWKTQEVTFAFGGFTTRLTPDDEVARIAHQAWTELSTRKAGILVEDDDVIAEVYESWYQLFGALRLLAKEVPVAALHDSSDAKTLLDTLVAAMNSGLRPHLTEHQARFREWWRRASEAEPELTPQERQRAYPHYDALVSDMRRVNQGLMELAENLRRLAHDREIESLGVRLVRIAYPRYKK